MSLTTSPEKISTSAETLEHALDQSRDMLAKLRKEYEAAAGDKKGDYAMIAQKLEQFQSNLHSGSEAAVSGAKHTIEDFRATLSPEHRAIYDKLQHGVIDKSKKLATEGADKAAEALKAANINVSKEVNDIAKAASEWNIDAAKKAAEDIAKKGEQIIEQNGIKLKKFTGMAVLDKVIMEPFRERNFFSAILQMIANIGKFFSSGFEWTEVIPDTGKDMAKKAAEKANETKDALSDKLPKNKERVSSGAETKLLQMKQKFEKALMEEWGINLADEKKRKALDAVWAKYHGRMLERAGRVSEGVIDNKLFNPLYELLWTGSDVTDFALDLIDKDVIPMGALTAKVAEGGKKAIRFGLSSAKAVVMGGVDEIEMLIGEISFDDLGEKLESLSPEKRALLTKIIVQKTALPLMLMGEVGAFVMNSSTLWATWNERVGWTAASAAYETSRRNFDKTAGKIDDLLKLLGEKNDKFPEVATNMRKVLVELQTKTMVSHWYMESQTAEEFASRLDAMKSAVDPVTGKPFYDLKSIDRVRGEIAFGKPLVESGKAIAKEIWNRTTAEIQGTLWERSKSWLAREVFKGPFANPQLFADELNAKSHNALEKIATAVRNKESWFAPRIWTRLRAAGAIYEVPSATSRGIVAINQENVGKFQQEIKLLIANEGPDMVRNFFSHLSLAVVTGLVVAAPDGQKLETLNQSLVSLVPIVGPVMLIGEGFTLEGMVPQHPAYVVTGGALLAYDSYQIGKIAMSGASGGWKFVDTLKFFARPITMAAGAVRDTAVLTTVIGKSSKLVFEAIKKWDAPEVGKLFAGMSLRSLPAAVAWVGVFAIGYHLAGKQGTTQEAVEAQLKTEWIIKTDGTYDLEKLKSRIATLDAKTKESVVAMMSASALFSQGKWTPLAHEVRPSGPGYNVLIKDRGTLADQEALRSTFASLGIPLSMAYSVEAQEEWMKRLRVLGYTDEQSRAAIWKQLGMDRNPDKVA